jgi:hypothetical protein
LLLTSDWFAQIGDDAFDLGQCVGSQLQARSTTRNILVLGDLEETNPAAETTQRTGRPQSSGGELSTATEN